MKKKPVGRPSKPESQRAKSCGFSAYPCEIKAIKAAAKAEGWKEPMDYIRSLIIRHGAESVGGKMMLPRST